MLAAKCSPFASNYWPADRSPARFYDGGSSGMAWREPLLAVRHGAWTGRLQIRRRVSSTQRSWDPAGAAPRGGSGNYLARGAARLGPLGWTRCGSWLRSYQSDSGRGRVKTGRPDSEAERGASTTTCTSQPLSTRLHTNDTLLSVHGGALLGSALQCVWFPLQENQVHGSEHRRMATCNGLLENPT